MREARSLPFRAELCVKPESAEAGSARRARSTGASEDPLARQAGPCTTSRPGFCRWRFNRDMEPAMAKKSPKSEGSTPSLRYPKRFLFAKGQVAPQGILRRLGEPSDFGDFSPRWQDRAISKGELARTSRAKHPANDLRRTADTALHPAATPRMSARSRHCALPDHPARLASSEQSSARTPSSDARPLSTRTALPMSHASRCPKLNRKRKKGSSVSRSPRRTAPPKMGAR